MISKKRSFFFFVFSALIIISSVANSNEIEPIIAKKKASGVTTPSQTSNFSEKILRGKKVEETFLGEISLNGIGLLSTERAKFPGDLWSNSSEKVLSETLNKTPKHSLASTNKIFKRLLLVDAKPPLNSIGVKNMGYLFLLSRVDQLIKLGAIDEAEEILNYIKEPSIEIMKRKIEVASLNGRISNACRLANKYPNFKGMLQFKIICLVRKNDWQAAALSFMAGSSLKQFDEKEKQLLLNYLDPDIEPDYQGKFMIDELSPINFYLMNGKKELIPPEVMPNKYAYAFSQLHMSSPKMRIKFMEQLASNYVVNTNTLFNLYRLNVHEDKEKTSNASMAVIELDQAFNNDSEQKKLLALKEALKIFYKKNLIAHLSNEYKNELRNLHHSNDKKLINLAIALLSLTDDISDELLMSKSTNADINCLINIKKKIFINYEEDTDLCLLVKKLNIEVIKKTFPKNKNYDDQMEKGLILLESLNLLENGYLTEFEELKLSLSMLTKIGLVDLVNEISTELIALNAIKKMVF